MSHVKPLIAITGRLVDQGRITNWRQAALAVPTLYVEAVQRGGGIAAVVSPTELASIGEDTSSWLDAFDGLLLTGGGDVDPARYGEDAAPETHGVDDLTDDFELSVLAAALRAGKPVLAICRGIQVLNVACGGTLDQHITGRAGLEDHGRPGVSGSVHPVFVDEGSLLAQAVGGRGNGGADTRASVASTVAVSCHHHQAVARVGDGLHVVARSADGVVEGLELAGPAWVVGVQWHPEDTAGEDPAQQGLFDAFVAETAAARRGSQRGS